MIQNIFYVLAFSEFKGYFFDLLEAMRFVEEEYLEGDWALAEAERWKVGDIVALTRNTQVRLLDWNNLPTQTEPEVLEVVVEKDNQEIAGFRYFADYASAVTFVHKTVSDKIIFPPDLPRLGSEKHLIGKHGRVIVRIRPYYAIRTI